MATWVTIWAVIIVGVSDGAPALGLAEALDVVSSRTAQMIWKLLTEEG